jgi:hypothetical protein
VNYSAVQHNDRDSEGSRDRRLRFGFDENTNLVQIHVARLQPERERSAVGGKLEGIAGFFVAAGGKEGAASVWIAAGRQVTKSSHTEEIVRYF